MQIFEELSQKILKNTNTLNTVYIACSGGVDSLFLVHFYRKIFKKNDIVVIIIDHNLQEDSAVVANETAKIVISWNCKPIILEWKHDKITTSIEENARIARYQLMYDYCKEQNAKKLVVAHHIDDKIETFFMNSMRGTGIRGLSSMREISYINGLEIFRPMVNCIEKKDIVKFMKKSKIPWFEDKTNKDLTFTRNNIRHGFKLSSQQKNGILKTIKNLELELCEKCDLFDKFWKENSHEIYKNDNIQIIFSENIFSASIFQIRMLLEKSFSIIYETHREIRQQTVKNFTLWLNSNISRANFSLMNFTKKNNTIICEKNN